MKSIFTFVSICCIFLFSCDKPACTNTNPNPIFDDFTPNTNEYKEELAKLVQLPENADVRYWVEGYEETIEADYLYVGLQGKNLCATAIIILKPDPKLNSLIESKGGGYMGAELKNLKIDIYQDAEKTEFIYKSMDEIVD